MRGTVIKILSVLSLVDTQDGVIKCAMRTRFAEGDTGEKTPLAVGDEVELEPTGKGRGVITRAFPRRTRLSRALPRDPRIEHVIVANVDQLLIVSSVRTPPLRIGLIDRYIIAGETRGVRPILCINKIDLAEGSWEYQDAANVYGGLGYGVLLTSVKTGAGLEELKGVLKDRSSVLAGHSGVGKSSLLNAIQPGLKLRTAPVDTRGRHCTSAVSLLKLDFGGYVADTPGVREFSVWDIGKRNVAEFFPEIWKLSGGCRMPGCIHVHEQDCAVKAALERGELLPMRYESYVGLMESVHELRVPRHTDVDDPRRQVSKSKRRLSRRTQKQRLNRRLDEDADES